MLTAASLGIVVDESGCDVDDLVFCGSPELRIPAETALDDVVALAVARRWVGLEGLSGISGSIGAAVRANTGAHGYRIGDTVNSVITWDLKRDQQRTLPAASCGFTNEGSALGADVEIRQVNLLLKQGDLTAPLEASLAELLGVQPGTRVPIEDVRAALTRP